MDIVNRGWGFKLKEVKLKEKLVKYNLFDNCEKLIVLKVNFEIWNKLKYGIRRVDLCFVNM